MMHFFTKRLVSAIGMVALLQVVSVVTSTSQPATASEDPEAVLIKSERKSAKQSGGNAERKAISGGLGSNGGEFDMFPKVWGDWSTYGMGFPLGEFPTDLVHEIYAGASPSAVEYWRHEELQDFDDVVTTIDVVILNGKVLKIEIDKKNSTLSPVINEWARGLIRQAVRRAKIPSDEARYAAVLTCQICHPKGYSIRTDTGTHLPAFGGGGLVTGRVVRAR